MKNKFLELIKKHKFGIILILLLTIIFSLSLFTDSIYRGHDITFHLNRINGIGNALRDGQILPKLYPLTNYEFGYAAPLFYSDVFMYPAAIMYMIGIPLIIAYKVNLFLYILLGTILAYICSYKLFKGNNKLIFILMVVYCLNPYRFIDCFYRSAFSEFVAITFFPLFAYVLVEIFYYHKDKWVLLGITMTSILLAHNLSFLLCVLLFGIVMVSSFFIDKQSIKKKIITVSKGTILALLLSCFYILPMLEQMVDQVFRVTNYSSTFDISTNIVPLKNSMVLFNYIDQEIFRSFHIQNFGVGIVGIIVPLYNLKFYKNKCIIVFTAIHYLFLGLTYGVFPIYDLEIFNFLQFSFRFYIGATFTTIFCVTYALYNSNKYLILSALSILFINICLFNFHIIIDNDRIFSQNMTYDNVFENEKVLMNVNTKQIAAGEYLPDIKIDEYMLDSFKIKEINDGVYKDTTIKFDRYMSEITFNFEHDKIKCLMLPLSYYKGYTVKATNGSENINLDIINDPQYKRVSFNTISGNYAYQIKYTGTLIQHLSLIVSSFSLLVILFISFKGHIKL